MKAKKMRICFSYVGGIVLVGLIMVTLALAGCGRKSALEPISFLHEHETAPILQKAG